MDKKNTSNGKQQTNKKEEQLENYRKRNTGPGKKLTDEHGAKISNDRTTLRAGKRGPSLLQDFHYYKKITHFTRERIPEKVVHARGFGVYGDFVAYKSLKHLTKADFLQEEGKKTPVFTRFSTFQGSKGSKDTAVDIRGFAVKFYTEEGNYDSLSLQFPVFIVSDAMKFMDVVHAAKPNPKSDIPQATTAHSNFWDYIANNEESTHMVSWLMSMRGRPRSWRMMAGWPINTFRFINEQGKATFVRFKWLPKLGVHSLLLEEANLIGGVDPDYHRKDIMEAIQKGYYPEYELGVQLIDEEDEFKFDFDILDDTKLWPEEIIPVETIGKMTLNRLVDDFFAEEEQSVFDPSHLIPGIDFSNDPVLQGRSIAYRDTELYRQHTANLNEIPVNKPINEKNNNYRGSYSKYQIDEDPVHFHKNSLAENTPAESSPQEGGYENYPEEVEGHVTREVPSDSFNDFYTQPRIFWNSLSNIEKQDLEECLTFHLQYVEDKAIRQKNVEVWANVDKELAANLAEKLGVEPPKGSHVQVETSYPSLSQLNTPYSAATQKVAVLIGNDFNGEEVKNTLNHLEQNDVFVDILSSDLGIVTGSDGTQIEVDATFLTKHPALYDSLYVVGGTAANQSKFNADMKEFITMTYKHYKPIGVATAAEEHIHSTAESNLEGVVFAANNTNFEQDFVTAISKHRFWERT